MLAAATPKWLPSQFAVNSGHVADGEGIVKTWEAIGEEMVCKQQQPQNGSLSHLAVNSGHVAHGEEIVRTWEAIGERHASCPAFHPPCTDRHYGEPERPH